MDYTFELKLKDFNRIFIDGGNPGVVVFEKVRFKAAKEDLKNVMLTKALLDYQKEFINAHIEVVITPCT